MFLSDYFSMEASSDDSTNDLHNFCKEAGRAFLNEFGLISHQINSYNDFIDNGIQKILDLLGEVNVIPDGNTSKKGYNNQRQAKIEFGKVRLEPPEFWTEKHDSCGEPLKFLPKHARLQNMTYSARLFVEVKVQVT